MRLYLSSTILWKDPLDQVIVEAFRYGFSGVEIWAEQLHRFSLPVAHIRDTAEEWEMALSFHAPSWDLNLCALNPAIRKQSVEEIKSSMMTAKEIRAPHVTVHPGRLTLTQEWISWHYEVLEESMTELAQFAEQHGILLSVEQMEHEKKEFIVDPSSMKRLMNNLPESVGTTFDTAHVPLHHDPLEYLHGLPRISKIHLSDAREGKYHVPLGHGSVRYQSVLEEVAPKDLPVVLEGFDDSQERHYLRANLEALAPYLMQRREPFANSGN